MTALKVTLDEHHNLGGTYTIATPAFLYQNMIMTSLTDNSRGNNSLPQNAWRFDFEKPLVALDDFQAAYGQFIQKIENGLFTTGSVTGPQPGNLVANSTGSPTILGVMSKGNPPPIFGNYPATILSYPAFAPSPGLPYAGIS
jgi:hypothetical protein